MGLLSALGKRGVRDLASGRMFGRLPRAESVTVYRGGPLNGYFWTPHEELARNYKWGGGVHRAEVDVTGFPVASMSADDVAKYQNGSVGAAETVDPFVLAQIERMRTENLPGIILENVPEPHFPPSRQIMVRDRSRISERQRVLAALLVGGPAYGAATESSSR